MPLRPAGILGEVIQYTMNRIQEEKRSVKLGERTRPHYSLEESIIRSNDGGFVALIAEFKRSSPRGIINLHMNPRDYAVAMRAYGASGLSVLTEPRWFLGSYEDVKAVSFIDIPLLMKDFVVDKWQIELANYLGFDAVLLISEALLDEEIREMCGLAEDLGLDVIIEVNSRESLARVLDLGLDVIIGINSRNLSTLRISINDAVSIVREVPGDYLVIGESGIEDRTDAENFAAAGVNAILVGTSLMRKPELARDLSSILYKNRVPTRTTTTRDNAY